MCRVQQPMRAVLARKSCGALEAGTGAVAIEYRESLGWLGAASAAIWRGCRAFWGGGGGRQAVRQREKRRASLEEGARLLNGEGSSKMQDVERRAALRLWAPRARGRGK